MKEMYSGEQAKAIDTHAIDTMGMPSLVLMEKAAMSVVSVLGEKLHSGVQPHAKKAREIFPRFFMCMWNWKQWR